MFTIVAPNVIIDLLTHEKIELNLYKGKEKIDVSQYLDDVSMWMDKSREMITDTYLPFCVLSVGITPIQVSAFMYGLFIGKGIEKHGLSIKSTISKMTKEELDIELKKNASFHNGILGTHVREDPKEKTDDGETQGKGSRV